MISKEIVNKVKQLQQIGFDTYIIDHGIEISFSNTLHEEACLIVCNACTEILLRDDLEEHRMRFAILHELGHYMLDVKDGTYSFFAGYSLSKSEFHANLFACLYLLYEADLYGSDIISYLIQEGCPDRIAINVFDYLSMHSHLSADYHLGCELNDY